MPSFWNDLPLQKQNPSPKDNRLAPPRTCIVGVGSDLRGDDSAGLWVARALLQDERLAPLPDLLVIEGGPAPENHTGEMRAFQPEKVLLIDAAHMDEAPGTLQWIPLEAIDGMSASSHSLPLSMLARFLCLELDCDVSVLGIQAAQNELDSELSPAVRAAVEQVRLGVSSLLLG